MTETRSSSAAMYAIRTSSRIRSGEPQGCMCMWCTDASTKRSESFSMLALALVFPRSLGPAQLPICFKFSMQGAFESGPVSFSAILTILPCSTPPRGVVDHQESTILDRSGVSEEEVRDHILGSPSGKDVPLRRFYFLPRQCLVTYILVYVRF